MRDSIRRGPGNRAWIELQAQVYGRRIAEAPMAPELAPFLEECRRRGVAVSVISHKTVHPSGDPALDLVAAARGWLRRHRFAERCGIPESRWFFEPTAEGKVGRIAAEGCTHFVDDLEEFFRRDDFPSGVVGVMYDPGDASAAPPGAPPAAAAPGGGEAAAGVPRPGRGAVTPLPPGSRMPGRDGRRAGPVKTLEEIPMAEADRRAIQEVVQVVRQRFPVEQVILFGSAARGRRRPHSDFDLLVLTARPLEWEERSSMRQAVLPLEMEHDRWFDLVAIPLQEWREGVYQVHPLRLEVERDGVVIP